MSFGAARRAPARSAFAAAILAGCITDDWRLPAGVCVDGGCAQDAIVDAGGSDASRTCDGAPVQGSSCGFNRYACALRCDGSVWCWGHDGTGQLGDGTRNSRSTPAPVRDLGGPASALSAGFGHACAIVRGAVLCWGENTYGTLGDGTHRESTRPVRVTGLPGAAVALAAGGGHTCAALEDGTVWCWGYNESGGLGDGTDRESAVPRAVVGLSEQVVEVVAGQFHTCARTRSGAVMCWGLNLWGAVGDGTNVDRHAPVAVALPAPAVALATLTNHTCAALDDGAVWCWGLNRYGAVGDGTRESRALPVRVQSVGGRAVGVAAGDWHTCAVLEGGSVRCWGANDHGQLGDGTTTDRLRAGNVVGLDGAAALVCAGQGSSCAALSDGRVRCWGANSEGELGDGSTDERASPVTVALPR